MAIDIAKLFDTQGFPVLGWVVHYQVRDTRLNHADVCTKLQEAGIDPSLAPSVRADSAFRRAFKSVASNKGEFARAIGTEAGSLYYGVVSQTSQIQDLSQDADFDVGTKGRFDKTSKQPEFVGSKAFEAEAEYKKHLESYSADQIRKITLRYLSDACRCFSVRADGGLYFVPFDKQPELERLQDFYLRIGATLSIIPIIDTETARDSLGRSSYEDLKTEVSQLIKEIDEIDGDKVKQKERKAETKFKKFQEVKTKIEAYEQLLSFSADDLKASLNELTESVKKKILNM